jgi:hypothetical protein
VTAKHRRTSYAAPVEKASQFVAAAMCADEVGVAASSVWPVAPASQRLPKWSLAYVRGHCWTPPLVSAAVAILFS